MDIVEVLKLNSPLIKKIRSDSVARDFGLAKPSERRGYLSDELEENKKDYTKLKDFYKALRANDYIEEIDVGGSFYSGYEVFYNSAEKLFEEATKNKSQQVVFKGSNTHVSRCEWEYKNKPEIIKENPVLDKEKWEKAILGMSAEQIEVLLDAVFTAADNPSSLGWVKLNVEQKEINDLIRMSIDTMEQKTIDQFELEGKTDTFLFIEHPVTNSTFNNGEERTWVNYEATTYLRDENGKYIKTLLWDDSYWNNEDSSVHDKLEMNNKVIGTVNGLYVRDYKDESFRQMENDPDYTYRVLDENNYWKDPKVGKPQFYERGAYGGSELMVRNPLTNGFEKAPEGVTRSYGQNFCIDEDKGIIYKRNSLSGEFDEDGRVMGECVLASTGENEVEIGYSYWSDKQLEPDELKEIRNVKVTEKDLKGGRYQYDFRYSEAYDVDEKEPNEKCDFINANILARFASKHGIDL